jgi:hypothetical protein
MKRSGTFLICLACVMGLSAIARAGSGAPAPSTPGSLPASAGLSLEAIQKREALLQKIRLQRLQGKNPSFNTITHRGLAFPQGQPGVAPQSAIPQLNNAPMAGASDSYTPSDTSEPNNPYASIVSRNVFALNPVPPPDAGQPDQGPPPLKITLTGITTIFGPAEALYKVAGVVRDGKPPQDQSYIMKENEGEDDVNVVHIDVTKGLVTFNNHNVIQEIPLQVGTASGGDSGGGPPGPGPGNPFQRRFGGPNPANMPPAIRARYMQRFGNNPNGNNNPAGGFNGGYNNGGWNPPGPPAGLSGDDQQALIAAQHAQMQQEGNPNAPLLPTSPYDDQAGVKQEPGSPGINTGQEGMGSDENMR